MTDTEIIFIRAIIDAPDNMARRLAYASWLDPVDAVRAEVVRMYVALNDPGNPRNPISAYDKDRDIELSRLIQARSQRSWSVLVEFAWMRRLACGEDRFADGSNNGPDARLAYGPCAICGRSRNAPDVVSRMPCERCGRVFCWQCADTGVHGSLADFRQFVSGAFSRAGNLLGSDSCLFCQKTDWMTAHGEW